MNHRPRGEVDRLLSVLLKGIQAGSVAHNVSAEGIARPDDLTHRARGILSDRRKRSEYLPSAMFGEPAWDMLLMLYVAKGRHRISMSQLAELSGAARSTACRWIDYLEQEGLVEKVEHPLDRRLTSVELTQGGIVALEYYLVARRAPDQGGDQGPTNDDET